MTIGERIRIRRKELGLTQEDLAKKLGNKSRASVCTVEKDKEDLTTTRIRQYADALECTPAYLMGWEDEDIMEDYFPNENISTEDQALLDQYHNVSPETKAAIDLLLKAGQQKT